MIITKEQANKIYKSYNIDKNSQEYCNKNFLADAKKWVSAIKQGRVICDVARVLKQGTERRLKYLSWERSYRGQVRGFYRSYYCFFKALGYKMDSDGCVIVDGCGMDMNFNHCYNIAHDLKSFGIITNKTCKEIREITPTII